ncbi:MAG: hypothetical protein IJM15_08390 [Erysipelotrichaceae bacterium]|nr:hypothetical protein [Erysipelotrichaceae bacterium]
MNYVFLFLKAVLAAQLAYFGYIVLQAKKRDPEIRFGLSILSLLQILFNGIFIVFGFFARYDQQYPGFCISVIVIAELVAFLLLRRIILYSKKILVIKEKIYDIRQIKTITVSNFVLTFDLNDGKKISVIDYVGSIAEMIEMLYGKINRLQRKKARK